jgi:hypothetical protein
MTDTPTQKAARIEREAVPPTPDALDAAVEEATKELSLYLSPREYDMMQALISAVEARAVARMERETRVIYSPRATDENGALLFSESLIKEAETTGRVIVVEAP